MDTQTATQDLANTWGESLAGQNLSMQEMAEQAVEDISGVTQEEHYERNEEQDKVRPDDLESLKDEYTKDGVFDEDAFNNDWKVEENAPTHNL